MDEITVEPAESSLKVHSFSTTIVDRLIKFEVLKCNDSIVVWVGEKRNRTFGDLSLALMTNFSPEPVATKIMGEPTNLTSNNLASKLSKRLGKPVYVSFNLVDDRLTVPVVNQRIAEEIQKNPQFF